MTPDFGCYFFNKYITVIKMLLCIKKSCWVEAKNYLKILQKI